MNLTATNATRPIRNRYADTKAVIRRFAVRSGLVVVAVHSIQVPPGSMGVSVKCRVVGSSEQLIARLVRAFVAFELCYVSACLAARVLSMRRY